MNKFLNTIKIILIGIFIYFKIHFNNNFYYTSLFNNTFIILFIIYFILTFKDFIKKDNILNDRKYLILEIIILLIINFIFIRCLYDKSFIYNDKIKYYEFLNYLKSINSMDSVNVKNINIFYLDQNIIYFNILYICLLIYRKINKRNKT